MSTAAAGSKLLLQVGKNLAVRSMSDRTQSEVKMAETRAELLKLARQGEPSAIATLIQQAFDNSDLTVTVTAEDTDFEVCLEGTPPPDEARSIQRIEAIFTELDLSASPIIRIEGRSSKGANPVWQATIALLDEDESGPLTTNAPEDISPAKNPPWKRLPDLKSVAGAVGNAASSVGHAAAQGGSFVSGAVVGTAQNIGEAALSAGSAIGQTSASALDAVGQTAMTVPKGLGVLRNSINDRPELRGLTKVLRMDWLLEIVDKVDVIKAEKQVRQLQAKHPDESPGQIARRIMTEKAIYVSGSGLASSLVPGFAAAMVAVDLAATTAIQAEMGYQIACAYGFDVRDEARKGEILAIFGLALGSNQALKTGFTYLARGIPIAGAAIGASANAVALYAVGHAAAQYYEAKRNSPNAEVELDRIAQEQSIQQAAAQQILMDQILTHVVVAGYPDTTWEALEPDLQALNLSPATLQIIQQEMHHPAPLEQLVDQLDEEFGVFLLAQCQRIAEFDGVVTEAEAEVLETIAAQLADREDETTEDKRSLAQNIRGKLFGWRQRSTSKE
jgi:uncharacterized protein (DUF697 family)